MKRLMSSLRALAALLVLALLLTGCGSAAPDPLQTAREAVASGSAPDLEALLSQNPEYCAWLSVPGTGISYPVSAVPSGANAPEDCLYLQSAYSSLDFSDSVTVVYGALASDGSLFGSLQRLYSEDGALRAYPTVTVYTPDRVLQYRVFGASLYNSTHLLNRFGGDAAALADSVRAYHVMSRQWDDALNPAAGESLLVLSVHAPQGDDLRYLVLAKQVPAP